MKKSDAILLVNLGILNATNHTLSVEHAYKVVKFRKALNAALEDISKEEEALRKDAGIEDAEAFDGKLAELRKAESPTKEQKKELEGLENQLRRFVDLRNEMLKQELPLDVKAMPYEEWRKLQAENKEKDFNGAKRDLFSGYAEDVLEGVLWTAPEE